MQAFVSGVAVWGSGLHGWEASQAVLAGDAPYVPHEAPPPAPALLSPTERRRTGLVVRLALAVAHAATEMAGAPADIPSVFASSNGDGPVVHGLLEALADPSAALSPTQFHNSVHNAAAGYWSIAKGMGAPITCLGCEDSTFAAGLLKALASLTAEPSPVLLCAYDAPLPPPLAARRPTGAPFAAAFVLTPEDDNALACIEARYAAIPPDPILALPDDPLLARVAEGNAAARSLRFLLALARGEATRCQAALNDGRLEFTVTPCARGRAESIARFAGR
jgi:hypothetical protein